MSLSANFISDIDTTKLKYVSIVEISLSTSTVYYSSRSLDSSVLTSLPYLTKHPSVSGSKVDLREVSSSVGNASFTLLDKNSEVTRAIVDETYINKKVSIYIYFDKTGNTFPTDAMRIFSGKIDSFTSDNTSLTFSCRENIFDSSKSLFDSKTNLSAAITNSETTIPVKTTEGFPTSGKIKIEDEIISYTGKTDTSFTSATRGALGSTAVEHDDDEDILEVWESGNVNPITLALQILLSINGDGANDATYDVLREGIGLDPLLVNKTSFTDIRDANSFGNYNFVVSGGISSALRFIEQELLAPTITRIIVNKESMITLIKMDQSEFTTSTESITDNDIISEQKPKLSVSGKEIINSIEVQYKWNEIREGYDEISTSEDSESISIYGQTPSSKKKFLFKGMQNSTQVDRFILDYLVRNSTPVPRVTFSSFLRKRLLEPGDDIRLSIKNTPNLESGTRDFNHLVEVLSVSQNGPIVNFEAAFTRFSTGKASFISPARSISSKTSETIFNLSPSGSASLFNNGMHVSLYDNAIGANVYLYCNFTDSMDANFCVGEGDALIRGNPYVSGGNLVLSGSNSIGFKKENCPIKGIGAFRIKIIPSYSGSPASNQYFLSIGDLSGLDKNTINIFHNTSGNLIAEVYDELGNKIVMISGAFSPTSGTTYEIELNLDMSNGYLFRSGASRLFLDGTQVGSTSTTILNKRQKRYRTRDFQYINLGTDRLHSVDANFSISEFIIFKAVQHTANYTPSSFVFTDPRDYRTITNITGETITIDSAFDITIDTSKHYLRFTDYDLASVEQKFWAFIAPDLDGFDDGGLPYVIKS